MIRKVFPNLFTQPIIDLPNVVWPGLPAPRVPGIGRAVTFHMSPREAEENSRLDIYLHEQVSFESSVIQKQDSSWLPGTCIS